MSTQAAAIEQTFPKVTHTAKITLPVIIFSLTVLADLIYQFSNSLTLCLGVAAIAMLLALVNTAFDPLYSIYVVMFLGTDALGLLPLFPLFGGTFHWVDLGIVYFVFLCFICGIKYRRLRSNHNGSVFLWLILAELLGAFIANRIYYQSIVTGVFVMRQTFLYLTYFPIISLIGNSEKKKKIALKEIDYFIKLQSVSFIIFLVSINLGRNLSNYSYGWRFGPRLWASNVLQVLGFLLYLAKIIHTRKARHSDIIWLIIFGLEVIFINQSRYAILCTAIASVLMLCSSRSKYRGVFTLILILLVAFLFTYGGSRISSFYYQTGDTLSIRAVELDYFNGYLSGHQLFGVGVPNQNSGLAALYSGQKVQVWYHRYYLQGISISDLGIYGIYYYFGIVGLLIFASWCFYSLHFCIKRMRENRKEYRELALFGSFCFFIFSQLTLSYFLRDPVFLLTFSILQYCTSPKRS